MLKVVGACLIAGAATLAGFMLSACVKRRLAAIECAVQATALLKSAVTMQLYPLQQAMEVLALQNELLNHLRGVPQERWPDAMRQFGLGKEEINTLLTLLHAIPSAAAGSCAHFDAAIEQLNLRLDAQRRAFEQSASMYPKLGFLCGAAVFLLLI